MPVCTIKLSVEACDESSFRLNVVVAVTASFGMIIVAMFGKFNTPPRGPMNGIRFVCVGEGGRSGVALLEGEIIELGICEQDIASMIIKI